MVRLTRPARRRRLLPLLLVAVVAALQPAVPGPAAAADPTPSLAPGSAGEAERTSDTAAVRVPFASVAQAPVAPGVAHDEGVWITDRGAQWVNVVAVDLQSPIIHVESGLSNGRVTGLETLGGQAARVSRDGHRVIAGINGDVWAGYGSLSAHAPNGLQILDGEVVTATRIKRPTLGILPDGSARMGDVGMDITVALPDGITILGVDRINKSRRFNDLLLYTRTFGASTLTSSGGVEVVLQTSALPLRPSGTFTGVVTAVRVGGNTSIPPGSIVLSADGLSESSLRGIPLGSVVTFTATIDAGWEQTVQAIGGREWVLRDGVTSIYPRPASAFEVHPRTGVGVTAGGDLVLVTVDGRQSGYSNGTTLPDLAELLRQHGAIHGLNLDGGGSTTMIARRPGDISARLANIPSDGRARPVSNSLLVVSTAPTGPLSTILMEPQAPTVVVGNAVRFTARGHDVNYNGIALGGITTWTVSPELGTIDAGGRFVATAPGSGTVTAFAQGFSASTPITVLPDTVPPVVGGPAGRMPAGAIASATGIPFEVSWAAAVETGSGVAAYRLRQRIDGGPWADLPLGAATARSARVSLEPGRTYEFGVSAIDRAGNDSGWVDGQPVRPRIADQPGAGATYRGVWRSSPWSGYLGGSGRWSGIAGASARFAFTGSQVAWVAPHGPSRGSARIYVDGRLSATVSLYRSATSPRRLAWSRSWSSPGRHTIEVRVVGTARHPKVDIDAFVVLDRPSTEPMLTGAGDIASCAEPGDSATAALLDGIDGTLFTAGDNAYETGSDAEFRDCYAPTWGRHRDRTRPTPGNHDYGTAGGSGYFAYFGDRAGTPGQGWYAYDVGTWRVYALNSNCDDVGGCGAGSAQQAWLQADLAANPRACVAAIWHHPLFSSGEHGNDPRMREIWDTLAAHGADVVINGHDHDYERFAPQRSDGAADPFGGMRQFVVGTGGKTLRPFATTQPNSEARSSASHGVLSLTLRAGSYAWAFVPATGSFTDAGSASCR